MKNLRISISGIRGVIGNGLNVEEALRWAQAFASLQNRGLMVVGRDTRPSGDILKRAVLAGLSSVGAKVVDLGICPTPTVAFMVKELKAAGGIIITASHNPPEWNALKFVAENGLFLNQEKLNRLVNIYENKAWIHCDWQGFGTITTHSQAIHKHIQKIMEFIDGESIIQSGLKVVVDACRGAGCAITHELLQRLGCTLIELDCIPDGQFTRVLEPRAENLKELAEKVKNTKADIGFALDPDADRLALVDENGIPLGEEATLALATAHLLAKQPGSVVVNLSTSIMVNKIAAKYNVPVYRTPVGEAYVVNKALEIKARIAGEGNGGVIVPAIHPGRDAATGMAIILEYLAQSGKNLSDLKKDLPQVNMVKTKLPLPDRPIKDIYPVIEKVLEGFAFDYRDGLRAVANDSWIHIRPSNTEPILRIIAETPTRENTLALCNKIDKTLSQLNG